MSADAVPVPKRKPFEPLGRRVRIAPDVAARQGEAVRLATGALGSRDAVLLFLNTHDDRIGGRPIDLAVANEAGLAAVKAVLALPQSMGEAALGENPDRGRATSVR